MAASSRLTAPALAVSSGLLLVVAAEPFALGPLAWIALVPLYLAVFRKRGLRRGFGLGVLCGAVYLGIHLDWIFLFGWMAWVGLVAALSLYLGAATALASVARKLPLAPVLAAGAWVGFELLRDWGPFGGYPWGAIGTTQASVPGVRWMAGVIGAYGLSFLCAFVAALIADRARSGRWAWGSVALVAGVLLLFVGVDLVRYGSPPPGEPVRFALIQGNVPRPVVAGQRDRVFESHFRLTQQLLDGPRVDAVVWPEDAVGSGVAPGSVERLRDLVDELGVPFLVGASEVDFDDRVFLNLVHHFDASGRLVGTYQKQHPVPFGEFVPLGFLRRFVTTLEQVPFDMEPGPGPVVFDVDGVRVGTPICFESVFPGDVRAFARAGAEIHIFSTNDSSFERSWASEQHLAHARMRSLELRQWTAQAALSGISAVVGPDGRVTDATELFSPAVVLADMEARPAHSLYARVGDLFSWAFVWGTALAFGLWLLVSRWPGRR